MGWGIGDICGGISKAAGNFVGDLVGDAVSSVAGKTVGNLVEGLVSDGIESFVGDLDLDLTGFGGNIAESLCDALLPKDLEVVGDLVAAAVNISTGNWPAAISDGLDALENVPAITSYICGQASDSAPTPPPSGQASSVNTTVADATQPNAGTDQTSSASNSNQASSTASTSSTSSTSASSSTSATNETKSKDQIETDGKKAAQAFLDANKNPEDLMAAIRSGNIPNEVLNSQGGMMMLQQQMNQIQMMNTMMTNMMKSMHDMSMAIASNMRV